MPIHVEIVSQEAPVFEEKEADIVLIPGVEGMMGVLPNHAPVLTQLGFGELIVRKGNAEEIFAIYGGVVEIRPDKIVVLADMAESAFALNSEAAEQARANAEQRLAEGVPPDQRREAALSLRRANLELRLSRKLKQRSHVLRILSEDEDNGR
jgi:F-type H+-transporting ATPase subunit epsilon